MSIRHWINHLAGFTLFPSPEERSAALRDWRDAVHDQRGEATKLMSVAVLSRRTSDEAIGTLRKVSGTEPLSPPDAAQVEQLRSLRAWLLARGGRIQDLTNDVVDRTKR